MEILIMVMADPPLALLRQVSIELEETFLILISVRRYVEMEKGLIVILLIEMMETLMITMDDLVLDNSKQVLHVQEEIVLIQMYAVQSEEMV